LHITNKKSIGSRTEQAHKFIPNLQSDVEQNDLNRAATKQLTHSTPETKILIQSQTNYTNLES